MYVKWLTRGALFSLLVCPLALFPRLAAAADASNAENFKVEVTGAAWLVDSSGTIQASGTPIDLVTDLGAGQQQPTFYGRLVLKPGRRHRIVLEGTPFRITGFNVVNRPIVYRGQTFNVSQTLRSSASLDYFFAGYQFDLLSGPAGHLGLSAGGAYLGATGVIHAVEAGTSASSTQTIGLPLAGAEGRWFPLRSHKLIELDGGLRGMAFGGYGNYFEVSANGGVVFGPFALLAGYRRVNADIHTTSSTNPEGVNIHLYGPIFSAQWRW